MRIAPVVITISATIGVIGCAAVDGIKSKAADFDDMDSMGDSRGLEAFDGPSQRRDPAPTEAKRSVRAPLVSPKDEPRPATPRPDGPTMEVNKTGACVTALRSLAGDGSVPPRTRALADSVLRCDEGSGRYDIRHAPCSLFPSVADDRAVDAAIQGLSELAPTCRQPAA